MAYTHKYVDGVLTPLNAADQAKLAARDAADWGNPPPEPATMTGTAAEKLTRMLKAHGLTLAEFKTTLGI